jgi:hypothetical protein
MSHRFGDNIEIRDIFSRRRIFVLKESDQHGFLSVSDFPCVHLSTHLVDTSADELDI